MPYFSIIIPTYNREHIIKPTIESILKQSFQDWELIIVDDGSTDNTSALVDAFNDDRIHYYWKQNEERGAARNFGAQKATGKYLNFFDSDDLMKLNHLEMAHDYIEKNPDALVVCFPWDYYDGNGKKLGERRHFDKDLNISTLKMNCIHLNGVFIEKELFSNHPFIADRNFNICEDWYFYMRLSLKTKLHGINEPSFDYIIHDESTMNNMTSAAFRTAIAYFSELIEKFEKVRAHRKYILSDLYGMLALAYALEGKRSKSIKYLSKVARTRFPAIFAKRTLGTIKNIIYAKRRG